MKSKESFEMNKTTAIHVASEITVVGGLFVYLLNRITSLEAEVAELKKDTQAVGAHQLRSEKSHAEAITELSNRLSSHNNNRPQPQPHVNHNHAHDHNHHVPQQPPQMRVRVPPTPTPPTNARAHPRTQQPPRVEVVEEQTEEELLESEFGDVEEDVQEEEQEEPEEEELPPPRRGKKAVTFTPTSQKRSATSMDDIKRRAAEMRARAGADE